MIVDWLADLWPVIEREWEGIQRHEGTLSQALAETFRTETLPGKLAFGVATAVGAAVLVVHIVTFEYSTKAGA